MSYNTKQKDLILESIKKKNKSFTIKELENELRNVGQTTIYRFIQKLVNEGLVEKNNNTYVYLDKCTHDNHFYLKCENCKSMIHVDCDCINELTHHITKNHEFKINKEHIIINGICSKCLKGGI